MHLYLYFRYFSENNEVLYLLLLHIAHFKKIMKCIYNIHDSMHYLAVLDSMYYSNALFNYTAVEIMKSIHTFLSTL